MKLWKSKELFVNDYSACLILFIAFILLLLVQTVLFMDMDQINKSYS